MEEGKKATPAAYLPFKTFLSSIEALEHGLPKKLDRSIWRQSGIVQGQIMMALRFFRLISDTDEPTRALYVLVEESSKRPQHIGELVRDAYADIIAHDLTKMTPKMLEDAMGAYGVQGDTRRKAIAFFLRAAKYAEMPMHPLLTSQTRNASNGVRRKRKARDGAADTQAPVTPPVSSQTTDTKVVKLPSGTVVTLHIAANWLDMSPEERTYVFGLVDHLHDHPGLDEPEEEEDEE